MNAGDITGAIPANKTTKNFSCNLGGCNLGNTRAQNVKYGQAKGPSMGESLSKFYKGAPIMGSGGTSYFGPVGAGWISPSSDGGYNYWQNGKVSRSQPAGQIPSSQIGLRAIDLPR